MRTGEKSFRLRCCVPASVEAEARRACLHTPGLRLDARLAVGSLPLRPFAARTTPFTAWTSARATRTTARTIAARATTARAAAAGTVAARTTSTGAVTATTTALIELGRQRHQLFLRHHAVLVRVGLVEQPLEPFVRHLFPGQLAVLLLVERHHLR